MATVYLTTAETTALIRKALKEAFPAVKFTVRKSGNSVNVGWTDGPSRDQVDTVAGHFSGAYFDGMIDYEGSIKHMCDGQMVSMGIKYVFCNRSHSPAAVAAAIDKAMPFSDKTNGTPTVQDYEQGRLWYFGAGFEEMTRRALWNATDTQPQDSATVSLYMIAGDDGYSRQCGSGYSAVPVDDLMAA
ncbi:hypothetical protein JFK97_20405 [Chromobacterium phragmitis]|uniref:LPD29 domain-containing protein n=1 Tax=Chromobacterium amazonense TaxID=1382803 RepID=UPI0021B7E54A|nr:LPD29 domain-containing protein [Chromobacterium amazonense]MBM2886756.1 hypothetical protein [Chromobacterium amazonense]